ncbi:hypothetical protein IC608_11500 [Devosia sp. PTR5]|uniref:Uncharacterized protein n=1 Tax=Devosia oryzisoli TaxID=2774138 RepID=A0A927FV59_9HYPH|nr:hypothetical protein [Devosia oryzisoli]MBD8066097.1 hypothetical protein [Devosia oryzisoli]
MIGTLIFILTGPILWAADLTIIYGAQSSLCAFGALPPQIVGWLVLAPCVILMGLVLLALAKPSPVFRGLTGASPPPEQWPFLLSITRLLGGISVLAMVYFSIAALLLPACGQLR